MSSDWNPQLPTKLSVITSDDPRRWGTRYYGTDAANMGLQHISNRLRTQRLFVSPTTVWRAHHRLGLGTRAQRLLVLDPRNAKNVGLLRER